MDKIISNVTWQYLVLKPCSTYSTFGFLTLMKSTGASITADDNLREYAMAQMNSE